MNLKTLTSPVLGLALLASTSPAQQGAIVAEQYLLQITNEHRAQQSLPPLAWDAALARAAHAHAVLIMQNPAPALHQYPGEPDLKARTVSAGAHYSIVSENVAGDFPNAKDLDRGWMNSPVHRANILDPRLNAIGIAVVQNHGNLYAVEDFSRAAAVLSPTEIEQQALNALRKQGIKPVASANAPQEARKTCKQPDYTPQDATSVMQWDGPDLNELPATLLKQMPDARSHIVAVGACPSDRKGEGFTTYHVAVVVY
jgi:uncharacterized protein YkwD